MLGSLASDTKDYSAKIVADDFNEGTWDFRSWSDEYQGQILVEISAELNLGCVPTFRTKLDRRSDSPHYFVDEKDNLTGEWTLHQQWPGLSWHQKQRGKGKNHWSFWEGNISGSFIMRPRAEGNDAWNGESAISPGNSGRRLLLAQLRLRSSCLRARRFRQRTWG